MKVFCVFECTMDGCERLICVYLDSEVANKSVEDLTTTNRRGKKLNVIYEVQEWEAS
jgi:hypothetical protein